MLKEAVKKFMTAREGRRYEEKLASSTAAYPNWYREHVLALKERLAGEDHSEGEKLTVEVVRYSRLRGYLLSGADLPDIVVAADDEGQLAESALTLIRDAFAADPSLNLLYGDEDRIGEDGQLTDPWLKPDWSPDCFLSTFYFGSIFAFRSSLYSLINPGGRKAPDYESRQSLEEDKSREESAARSDLDEALGAFIYGQLCLRMAQAEGGFSRRRGDRFPIGHIPEILFHRTERPVLLESRLIRESLTGRYSKESATTRLTSIIIPSKDHPSVLKRCLDTIEKYTDTAPYELVIVDNGSSAENRAAVETILEHHRENGLVQYIYEPMEFNFSRMCNLGARHANGELLLFLNDDIEIRRPGWLSYLSEKAKLPHVGAVGMKLLYPDSDVIQHAGVVNVKAGPIHKLQFTRNNEQYFGFNKGVRNVLAVTGACLMVRSELFEELGGFDEARFAVAFNDIDLCYRIYEKGYYNVVRNNMYLYHHESLSRGDDRKDTVKSARLSRELYELLDAHRALYGRDPFYHPLLTQDPAEPRFVVDFESPLVEKAARDMTPAIKRRTDLPPEWEDKVLRIGVEYAHSLENWRFGPFAQGDPTGYYIKGYSFVIGADNAVYERRLLLRPKGLPGPVYELAVEDVERRDIAENLTDQIHDGMTGFMTVMKPQEMPRGEYEIGMLAIDRTSRQRLTGWTDVILSVGTV